MLNKLYKPPPSIKSMKKESKLALITAGTLISLGTLISGCQGTKVYFPDNEKYPKDNYRSMLEQDKETENFVHIYGPAILLK
jgi:hypothetical protein